MSQLDRVAEYVHRVRVVGHPDEGWGLGRAENAVRLLLGREELAAIDEHFPPDAGDDLVSLPQGVYEGANRYDTDNEHVLHLWKGGESFDIRLPKPTTGAKP